MGEPFRFPGARQAVALLGVKNSLCSFLTPQGFSPYRSSTGFPFSCDKNRSKIWENLFDSPAQDKQLPCLGSKIHFVHFCPHRGSLLTVAVQVSHFLAIRIARKYGRTFSIPRRKTSSCLAWGQKFTLFIFDPTGVLSLQEQYRFPIFLR